MSSGLHAPSCWDPLCAAIMLRRPEPTKERGSSWDYTFN